MINNLSIFNQYPKSVKNENLHTVYFLLILFTLLFNRPWAFSIRATANTLYTAESVNFLVYLFRIAPLLIILIFLLYKDLISGFLGIKVLFTNYYFLSGTLYVIISAVSAYWVYKDYFSIWKSAELMILIYFSSFIFKCKFNYKDSRAILFFTVYLYIIYIVISGILAFLFPEISFRSKSYQFFPIFPMVNPNVMGNLALIIFSFVILSIKRSVFWYVLSIYLFSIFIFSISRTAYVCFLFILVLLCSNFLFQISTSKKVKSFFAFIFISVISFILFILPFYGTKILDLASRGQSTESLRNLSSRTLIWEASRLSIKEKPLFGYGLYSETRRLNKRHPYVFEEGKIKKNGISNTHGSIYEILLASGFIGGTLYLLLFFYTMIRSALYLLFVRTSVYSQFSISICIIFIIIFFRFSTGGAISGFGIFTFFYFLIISLRLLPWRLKHNISC